MTDDQFWRIILGGGFFGLCVVFREKIDKWLHSIGYRDWRSPDKKD